MYLWRQKILLDEVRVAARVGSTIRGALNAEAPQSTEPSR